MGRRIGALSAIAALAVCAGTALVTPAAWAEDASNGATPGCAPSVASAALDADEARALFGVDGSGVKVGVISNSFNTAAVPTAADDVLSGALPGPGNPCGYTTPVTVVRDGLSSEDDEGRAMAQVVHGIAPGAELFFASPQGGGAEGLATAIELLVGRGVDVIVDDIQSTDEHPIISNAADAAIQAAVDSGVTYVTAAGNDNVLGAAGTPSAGYPIAGWASESYHWISCPDDVSAAYPDDVSCIDFDPAAGSEDPAMRVSLPAAGSMTGQLSWVGSANIGYVLTFADGSVHPVPRPDPSAPVIPAGLVNLDRTAPADVSVSIVLEGDSPDAVGSPPLQWVLEIVPGGAALVARDIEYPQSTDEVAVGGSMSGHNANPAAIRVAAVDSSTFELETFSSGGPALRSVSGSLVTVPGPTVAGVDGVPISFDLAGGDVFYGTSAAAPSIAGVLALALQHAPGTGVADLTAALTSAARPDAYSTVMPADVDRSRFVGAGLADAVGTLLALGPAPAPVPGPVEPGGSDSGGAAALAATGMGDPGALMASAVLLVVAGAGARVALRRRSRAARSLR
ncbi:hypothetical protein GCM10010988_25190 [Cnuibacter physcomitrellae]|uniref:Peptidase S8/S53 domain-containing protein n=1 Tax=Cnuibacter physcomitrellae TaxID=1619308 RepID=A0A1X9LF91_9MICO|nr:S8 family serine peptidase [Cnuibacter physcomitrellae]ARJ03855.1 hypothetical protein B5808_00360 [Cnuibacter physcomitrellae]GGI39662.1 hypothetical protein GCM10010988_25190 [Cnuibacter physcomitrellae]